MVGRGVSMVGLLVGSKRVEMRGLRICAAIWALVERWSQGECLVVGDVAEAEARECRAGEGGLADGGDVVDVCVCDGGLGKESGLL